MSQNSEYASHGNGNEAPHNELLDAIASADEATAESIAAPARDVIACKIASIVDGMDGIQRNHNGRYPAHSIDQVVSAVSYGTKDFLKRQFMIADDSDDPDFKGGGSPRVNPQTLDGQLVPVISIEPNTRKRSERSPGWFAKDESDRISVALWESSFKTFDMLLRWNSGTMREILAENENRHRFSAPLMLRVEANQHGLSLAADGQLNTMENPAVADQFLQIARNIIPESQRRAGGRIPGCRAVGRFPSRYGLGPADHPNGQALCGRCQWGWRSLARGSPSAER